MSSPWDWSQLGLAGTVAVSLGGVIAYVFRLFTTVQQDAVKNAIDERDSERHEVTRLHALSDEQQRIVLITLADVTRVMSEVQQMLREREIQLAVERAYERTGKTHGGQENKT